jgi:hypothetical protein
MNSAIVTRSSNISDFMSNMNAEKIRMHKSTAATIKTVMAIAQMKLTVEDQEIILEAISNGQFSSLACDHCGKHVDKVMDVRVQHDDGNERDTVSLYLCAECLLEMNEALHKMEKDK